MSKSSSERKATERQRKREQGLVPVEVWIRPEHKAKLKEFEIEHQKEGVKMKIYYVSAPYFQHNKKNVDGLAMADEINVVAGNQGASDSRRFFEDAIGEYDPKGLHGLKICEHETVGCSDD